MNILYIAHRIPYPPDKGDKMRAFRQLDHLARSHRVWCACFIDDPADRQYVADLESKGITVAAVPLRRATALARGALGKLRGGTMTESAYESRAMRRTLDRWTRTVSFDVAIAFSGGVAPIALHAPARRHVLDLCDLDSRKWLHYAHVAAPPLRLIYSMEGRRLASREIDWIKRFDATLLISEAERNELNAPKELLNKVRVVPNGVTLPDPIADNAATHNQPHRPTVGFIGVMDYRPNVDAVSWFARDCWPYIRSIIPDAEFRIVGRRPTRIVRGLARIPGVTVVGPVPDVQTELRRFDVSVAPLRIARGVQNKVLEAMAAARPIVLTPAAATGIEAENGLHYCLAAGADDMIAETITLLKTPRLRTELGLAARDFVGEYYRWPDALARFDAAVMGTPTPHYASKPKSNLLREPVDQPSNPAPVGAA